MPFGLKNAGATYQKLMNKVFAKLIGDLMEVYIDDMLIKTKKEESLLRDLEVMFIHLRQHNMRLNPHKCAFAVEAGKFLGFMVTNRELKQTPTNAEQSLK